MVCPKEAKLSRRICQNQLSSTKKPTSVTSGTKRERIDHSIYSASGREVGDYDPWAAAEARVRTNKTAGGRRLSTWVEARQGCRGRVAET